MSQGEVRGLGTESAAETQATVTHLGPRGSAVCESSHPPGEVIPTTAPNWDLLLSPTAPAGFSLSIMVMAEIILSAAAPLPYPPHTGWMALRKECVLPGHQIFHRYKQFFLLMSSPRSLWGPKAVTVTLKGSK